MNFILKAIVSRIFSLLSDKVFLNCCINNMNDFAPLTTFYDELENNATFFDMSFSDQNFWKDLRIPKLWWIFFKYLHTFDPLHSQKICSSVLWFWFDINKIHRHWILTIDYPGIYLIPNWMGSYRCYLRRPNEPTHPQSSSDNRTGRDRLC